MNDRWTMRCCEHCGCVLDARYWKRTLRKAFDDFDFALSALCSDWDMPGNVLWVFVGRGLATEFTADDEKRTIGRR